MNLSHQGMKYPKECVDKAMDVLERHYFREKESASNMELLTLEAHCINTVDAGLNATGRFRQTINTT